MALFSSGSVEETVELGRRFSRCFKPDDVLVLSGDLGAGKTQFSKGVAVGLGVTDDVTSPTFNILVEYEGDELPLFHFDLYRLDDPSELDDIDFFGTLESEGVSLVEWGDKFPDDMPAEFLSLFFTVDDDGLRKIEAKGEGARGRELEEAFSALLEEAQ